MDLIPTVGELSLIAIVILLIFVLGRLPQISYALAGAGKHGERPKDAPPPGGHSEEAAKQSAEAAADADETAPH